MVHHLTPEFVEKFLKRLRGTEGKVYLAAQSLGIHPHCITRWRKLHPEFDRKVREVIEGK